MVLDKFQIDGIAYDINANKALMADKASIASTALFADNAALATTSEISKNTETFKGKDIDYFAKNADIQSIPYLYSATFFIDNWSGAGPYSQTVKLESMEKGGEITSNDLIASGPMCEQTNVQETNELLQETLNLFNSGYFQLGENFITAQLFNKPTMDIKIIWLLKKVGV